jgi:hypothetical protein
MNLDALRAQACNLHRSEYILRTRPVWREKFFLYPAATLLKGGLVVAGLALGAMLFGVATAGFVFAGALVATAASLPLLSVGASLHDRRVEAALQRDFDAGLLTPPSPRVETPAPKLGDLSAGKSFNLPSVPPTRIMPPLSLPRLQPATM